jgi:hypothetical protein
MRIIVRTLLQAGLILSLGLAVAAAGAVAPPELKALDFLVGEWEATGGGAPGQGAGRAVFARTLMDRTITRTSYAEFPDSSGRSVNRHEDFMVIHVADGADIRADYYDSEGNTIRYAVTVPAPDEAVFVSDIIDGAPRFRLTYKLAPDGVLGGAFEVAPPGRPDDFMPYLAWESRAVRAGSRRGSTARP